MKAGRTILQTEKGNEMPLQMSLVRSIETLEDGRVQVVLVREETPLMA